MDADKQVILNTIDSRDFGDCINHLSPLNPITDVTGNTDDPTVLLVDDGGYFTRWRSEFSVVKEQSAKPLIQLPILGSDTRRGRCASRVAFGINALGGLVGSRRRSSWQSAINRRRLSFCVGATH
jgi:hypothetical protein